MNTKRYGSRSGSQGLRHSWPQMRRKGTWIAAALCLAFVLSSTPLLADDSGTPHPVTIYLYQTNGPAIEIQSCSIQETGAYDEHDNLLGFVVSTDNYLHDANGNPIGYITDAP